MSDSVQPHGRQPTRLPHPWDSPGKNIGVGCHFLLQCVKVKLLSRVRLFATPWTAACQPPPSMGVSRQESWSGLPSPSPGKRCTRCRKLMNLRARRPAGGALSPVSTAEPKSEEERPAPLLSRGTHPVCSLLWFPSQLPLPSVKAFPCPCRVVTSLWFVDLHFSVDTE